MQAFKVSPGDVDNFARVWTHKGIFFPQSEMSRQFATDFANVAIKSFVEKVAEDFKAAKAAKEAAEKPLVTL